MPAFYKVLGYKAVLFIKKQIITKPQPRPVVFAGADGSRQLCRAIGQLGGRNVLIVTDKPLVELGIVDIAVQALQGLGIETHTYDGVLPDPTVKVVDDGLAVLRQHGCDAVLAFGGGSSIDCAKVIALAATNDFTAMDCVGLNKGKNPPLPLYAIPTTAGTGSEVTVAAVISDNETHEKLIVGNRAIVPRAAALDPGIMTGLPAHITAATGMDALTHAVESYLNDWRTPETAAFSLAATRLVFANLERACTHGEDLEGREAMALASYYGGLAFTSALVGYVHAVSHQLGAHYGIPHGLGNAVVLPRVLELFRDSSRERLAELARHCGMGSASDDDAALARAFIDGVWQLNAAVGIPRTLDAVREADVGAIVDAALKEGNGYPVPRFIERRECEQVVRGLIAA